MHYSSAGPGLKTWKEDSISHFTHGLAVLEMFFVLRGRIVYKMYSFEGGWLPS